MEQAYEAPSIADLGTLAELTLGSTSADIPDNDGLGGFAGSLNLN